MLERFEALLSLIVSLISTLSVVLGLIFQIMQWMKQPDADETIAALEKDIIRLDKVLQEQQHEIKRLQEARTT